MPLYITILNNYIKTTKLLIENGADVNIRNKTGGTLLHITNNFQIVKVLIENGADINARNNYGQTPLHWIRNDNLEIAKLLIESGADVNAKNNKGNTPLHNVWNIEKAKLLVDSGADVNARNKQGQTPCDKLAFSNYAVGIFDWARYGKIKNFIIKNGGEGGQYCNYSYLSIFILGFKNLTCKFSDCGSN